MDTLPLETLAIRKNALLIAVNKRWWHEAYIDKLRRFYATANGFYVDSVQGGYTDIIPAINRLIGAKEVDVVFIDANGLWNVNLFFIQAIKCSKKVLVITDIYKHDSDLITASACDVCEIGCPINVLKYQEKGHWAVFSSIISDERIFRQHHLPKDIDVLYFGSQRNDRKSYLDYIRDAGVSLTIVEQGDEAYTSDLALARLISRSKIVVNFSKLSFTSVKPKYYFFLRVRKGRPFKSEFQLKGRIFLSALCGTAFVTEHAPAHRLVYPDHELYQFRTKEECVNIIEHLLDNPDELKSYTETMHAVTQELYSDKNSFMQVVKAIEESGSTEQKLNYIPYGYIRRCVNEVVCRNFSVRNIFEAKIILTMVRDNNILVKLVVLLEFLAQFLGSFLTK
mgnify:FL=1